MQGAASNEMYKLYRGVKNYYKPVWRVILIIQDSRMLKHLVTLHVLK